MDKIKVYYSNPIAYYKLALYLRDYINENSIIICIGTDKCIGDSLGPIVGSLLKNANFPLPVFGTISDPIHALNLNEKINMIKKSYPHSLIIAIDACLGEEKSVGCLQFRKGAIHPGKGVGKKLPSVGDVSLLGIVDSFDSNGLINNRNIRLDLIVKMAIVIKDSIFHSYYLYMENRINFNNI